MATLIQSYEQQYSVLTADITAKIGRLKSADKDDRDELSKEILLNFEEANDLLEQLELECRGAGGGSRVPAYRAELQRVRQEYRSAVNNSSTYNAELEDYDDDWSTVNEQQRKLLDNTEKLERTGKNLTEGYRLVLETEQLGAAVLQDLSSQRESIQRSRGRLRETEEQLDRSSRLVQRLRAGAARDGCVLALGGLLVTAALAFSVYLTLS